ncbi:MAG: DMT family transporter [Clostridia bacterium]|nr:DMT family transporter [Clostridia bacterium]
MNNKTKGIILIILSAFSFAWMFAFVRLAGDVPFVQKTFFRNFFAALLAMGVLVKSGIGFGWRKENTFGLFMRAGFGALGVLCNFYAIGKLMTADASILNKLSPFFAIIFSIFILNEKVKLYQAISVVIAFIGALFVIQPGGSAFSPAMLIAAFGGMCAGLAYTYVRKVTNNGEKGPTVVFFFSVFSCLITAPYLIFNFYPMTMHQWLSLIGAGIAAAGGQFTITAAYSYAPAREISVFDYTQIVFTALLGFLMFGDVPNAYSFIGYFIIVGVSVVMFFINKRQAQ